MNIMHTMASVARPRIPKRQFYSPELKLQVVTACAPPGASIAGGHCSTASIPTSCTGERMAHKLRSSSGRAVYALRKQTVEPVFGIIKSVMGF